jgi:hypothetical protein
VRDVVKERNILAGVIRCEGERKCRGRDIVAGERKWRMRDILADERQWRVRESGG